MKLTKFQHACFELVIDDRTVVIDPGSLTDDFALSDSIAAVVVTHFHPDHVVESKLQAISEKNPSVELFGPSQVVNSFPTLPFTVVQSGDVVQVGDFKLRFTGGKHAVIDESFEPTENIGVLINDQVYYPGDSFVPSPLEVTPVLLAPVSAPWLKISETMDFLRHNQAKLVVPTHVGILSKAGMAIVDRILGQLVNYRRLQSAEVIDVNHSS